MTANWQLPARWTPAWAPLLAAVALCQLGGCDKLREHDELVAAMAARAKESQQTAALLAEQEKEIAILRADLALAKDRLATIEATKTEVKNRAALASGGTPADQLPALRKAIAECASNVRGSAMQRDPIEQKFFSDFDAYYNPAAGRVQDNVIYNGGLPAKYQFNKCMTEQGWPLS